MNTRLSKFLAMLGILALSLPTAANQTIYDGILASPWVDWSWNATTNEANTSPVQSATDSIAVTITSAWGALYLHANTAIDLSTFTAISFWVYGGMGGNPLFIKVNGTTPSYAFTAAAGTWTKITVPFSAIGNPTTLSDIYWQDASGNAQSTFFLDAITLVSATAPGACATIANTLTAPPSTNGCAVGTVANLQSPASPGGNFTWTCAGLNGGASSSTCTAAQTVNGACGTANGAATTVVPSGAGLCAAGNTATAVAGTGPWTWGCNGSNGGTNTAPAACTASATSTSSNGQTCPTAGLWVIDSERNGQPGRGFTIEEQGGVLVLTVFAYDSRGNATFYQSAGAVSNRSFGGGLDYFEGGTTFGGPWKSASLAGSAGQVTINFTDSNTGTITFPGEATKTISKFNWANGSNGPGAPISGLWAINSEENGQPGRGFAIEDQGNVLVVTIYGYDSSGGPTFYQSSGTVSNNSFAGSLAYFAGGTAFGGSWKSARLAGSAGQLVLNFTDSNNGTITFPGEMAKAISKFNWGTPCSGSDSTSSNSGRGGSGGSTSTAITFMGSSKVLIGGSFSDATAAAAPFDVRYAYVHSKPAASPTYYTDSFCSSAATASGWWGCWPGETTPPGYYVTWWNQHVAQATWQGTSRPQMFFWTWYSLRDLGDMAGQGDGPGEVQAINRTDLLTLYMNDYRFFLQKIGTTRAMVDIEPDFWGYVKSLGNPHSVPAQVTAANPTDCATQENSAAGLAHCLVSMARKYAPNLGVGMHASCFDYQTDPQGCVNFLKDMTTGADFMVGDVSDRDAAWYDLQGQNWHWWNGTKGADALAFYKLITEGTGKPLVLWQIPLGNMAQNNTLNHYQDDKVDYLFSHMNQVADAHIVALLFGAGQQEQTTPETDGGNLISKTISYWSAGGTPLK